MTRHQVCDRLRDLLDVTFPRDLAFEDASVTDVDVLIEVVGDMLDAIREQLVDEDAPTLRN